MLTVESVSDSLSAEHQHLLPAPVNEKPAGGGLRRLPDLPPASQSILSQHE